MTNDVFVMQLDSVAIAIVEIRLRSVGDTGNRLAIRLGSMRSSSDLFALWTDLCARESTDGDLGNQGDQLETNQRSISLCEIFALHKRSMAPFQMATDRRLVEWGYYTKIINNLAPNRRKNIIWHDDGFVQLHNSRKVMTSIR